MNRYADIALPVAIEKAFTYIIPPELHSVARIGSRAIVPFGRTHATGLIVGLPPTTSIPSVKPVHDIIDAEPVVSAEMMKLCQWIADYYVCPVGEVFKAAIPHGFTSSGKRRVTLTAPLDEATLADIKKQTPKRAAILRLLADRGALLSTDLRKRTGLKSINAVLNDMARTGLVEIEDVLPHPKHKPKTQEFVLLGNSDNSKLAHALSTLPSRKKNARALLTTIIELKQQGRSEIAVSNLLKLSGTSSAVLKELKRSAVLDTEVREVTRQQEYGTEEQTLRITLNEDQQHVLRAVSGELERGEHATFLLHGVTGSGKTQVYIEAIRQCLALGKSAIVLVPEISLTPQIVRRFRSHFKEQVAVVHSRMSPAERNDVWRLAARGDYRVVIGPRSAVFAPLRGLGLLVVDEEHEASYKQYDANPRYHARDVAVMRGSLNQAVVLLGSATPSIESYQNATASKYRLATLQHRIDRVPMPDITIVDMTAERRTEYKATKASLPEEKRGKLREFQQSSISALLRQKIAERLERREGVILLQNRRGFAPFIECLECGYAETCTNCSVTLTYHLAKKHLRCHYCGLVRAPHTFCPQCNGPYLQLRGVGTQRVEQELASLFPDARVIRMDLDTTRRKGAHDRILRKFGDGEADILLGTQMVAKGLDFPRVTLVGVISADTQMLLPDFRSSERTFQILTQVSGRAGRSELHGEVVIQTHQPAHYTLRHVVEHDYEGFFRNEIEAREELSYPPLSRIVLIEARGEKEEQVKRAAEQFARSLKGRNGSFAILGPSPAVIAKIKNNYRWHVIIKAMKSSDPAGSKLRQAVRTTLAGMEKSTPRSVRLVVDVDPVGLL